MKLIKAIVCLVCVATSPASVADAVKSDDTIVKGGLCIGTDCVIGADFSNGVLMLAENNLRIRFHDSSATSGPGVRRHFENTYLDGVVGQSWRVDANDSSSGGENGFYFLQYSVEDYPIYSDGSAPDYDCSDLNYFSGPNPPEERPSVGTIAEGETAEDSRFCQPYRDFVQLSALAMGGGVNAGLSLGIGAEVKDGEVSIGNAEMKRRLVHVARAIRQSDALIKEQMDLGLFQEQLTRLNEVESLVNMAEKELQVLEAAVKPKGGGGAAGWLMLLLPLAAFKLRNRKLNS